MKWLALLLPSLAFGQCYQSTNEIRPYGCDYIVEVPPILSGEVVTRCYTLDPQSINLQPGFISVQSSGCGPIAYGSLSYSLYDDTCGVLITSGSIFPLVSNPVAFLPDSSVNYLLCFTFTALCDSINAVCASYVFTTVPVELLYFTGDEASGGVMLKWATASEANSARFNIYRSDPVADGLFAWKLVGWESAATFSRFPIEYQFLDRAPLWGLSYYLLEQVDIDGSVHRFRAIAVRLENERVGSWLYWFDGAGRQLR